MFIMKPAIFLDRDGTINVNCPYCKSPDEIVFYKDIFKPLERLSKDYYIIIITNQSGIARGYFTRKDLEAMHDKIKREVLKNGGRIDAVYYCPHLPDEGCGCRKPKTGLIDSATEDFPIDMHRSFFIGDSDADMELARNVGIRGIRIREKGKVKPDYYANSFKGVISIINKSNLQSTDTPRVGLILAGGKGTRMKPFTYRMPKPMVRIRGKPVIWHIVNDLAKEGVKDIFISVGYKAESIMEYLGNGSSLNANITYVKENEPLGTGGGIKLALRQIRKKYDDVDVFVANGDDLFKLSIEKMYRQHKRTHAAITIALKKAKNVTSGHIEMKGRRVVRYTANPNPSGNASYLSSLGRYILNTKIIARLPKRRAFSIESDFMQQSAKRIRVYGYPVTGRWYQINTPEQLKEARKNWKN